MDEQKLVEAARQGSEQAFREIVKRYESRVASTVIGMLGECDEADDVGQEVFIRLYKSLSKFRGEASLGTYVTRIAINLSLNELKRRKRQSLLHFFKPADELIDLPDKKNHFEQRAAKELVNMALQKLDPPFRMVVVLRLIDGYSTQETADILKIPVGTVLSRLTRGQKKLRDILSPDMGGSA